MHRFAKSLAGILVIILSIGLSGCDVISETELAGQSRYDGSTVTYVDGWLYQGGTELSKTNSDGSEKIVLSDQRCDNVQVLGDWVFYRTTPLSIVEEGEPMLYRIRSDGTGKTKVGDIGTRFFLIADGWVYFLLDEVGAKSENNGIHRLSLTNKKQETLYLGDIESMDIADGWVYFDSGGYLYKMKVDGSELTKLVDDDKQYGYEQLVVHDDWIYFCYLHTGGQGLFRIKTNGTETMQLSDDPRIRQIRIAKEWVLYQSIDPWHRSYGLNEPGILDPPRVQMFQMRLDGTEKVDLMNGYFSSFGYFIVEGWVHIDTVDGEITNNIFETGA